MSTHLIFIRHAQSTWNELRRWQGHADPPLAEAGREQARLLARRLARWRIDHLYTSDLTRAAETAAIVGEALGLAPTADPIWRERGFGALEGLTSEEIAQQFPEAWASRMFGPIVGVPGAELQEAVLARAQAGVAKLLQRHPGETVAVVSHGGMIMTILVSLLELPPSAHRRITVGGNTAISRVAVDGDHARLVSMNDAAHLELGVAERV
jgi:broad specificity phosphatase PhoE